MDEQTLESKPSRGARLNAGYLRQEDSMSKRDNIKISPMVSQQPNPHDKEEKKKMPEVEKSSFEDDFVYIEEQKKPS